LTYSGVGDIVDVVDDDVDAPLTTTNARSLVALEQHLGHSRALLPAQSEPLEATLNRLGKVIR